MAYQIIPPSFDFLSKLNDFRNKNIQTDIIFELPGEKISAHKLILSAYSEYFNVLLNNENYKNIEPVIPITNTKPIIFKSYIEFIYNNIVKFDNWRDVLDFILFLEYTGTDYNHEDETVINMDIKTDEYIEYINKLTDVYNGEIPSDIIGDSAKFIKGYVNLLSFSDEFINVVINSPMYNPDPVSKIKIKRDLGVDIQSNEILNALTKHLYDELKEGNPICVMIQKNDTLNHSILAHGGAYSEPRETKLLIHKVEKLNKQYEYVKLLKFKPGATGHYNLKELENIDETLKGNDVIEVDDYTFYETDVPIGVPIGEPIKLKDFRFVNVKHFNLLYKHK
jgi:hypothetical protein